MKRKKEGKKIVKKNERDWLGSGLELAVEVSQAH